VYSDLLYLFNNKNITKVQVCREHFVGIPSVIYTRKNFYLVKAMDDMIENLKSAGLIEYWYLQSFSKKISKKMTDDRKKLSFSHLSGCFQIWVGGCFVSFLGLIGELIVKSWRLRIKTKKRQFK
jgi:hypothetical protein